MQGGPLMHVVAAKAVGFGEALQPAFRAYAAQIIANARTLAHELMQPRLPPGVRRHRQPSAAGGRGLARPDAARRPKQALDAAGITVNKNMIPFDTRPPLDPSGIRIGTPALTTRGMREPEMRQIARLDRRGAERPGGRGGAGKGACGGAGIVPAVPGAGEPGVMHFTVPAIVAGQVMG